jgi:hypothetical protein
LGELTHKREIEKIQLTTNMNNRRRKEQRIFKKIRIMTRASPCLPIITLNINGLNSPIKKYRLDKWIKTRPQNML